MDRFQSSPADEANDELTPQELHQLLASSSDILLLDVREAWEYHIVHLEEAKLIPLHDLPSRLHELDPHRPMAVYCHHGMRSYDATCFLRDAGFANVKSLTGGIDRWSAEIDPSLPRY
jgi:rhodanese-related sulfurtransferase